MPSSRLKYYAANSALLLFLVAVIYSGFGVPRGWTHGVWPFNADWGMFSWDDNRDFKLRAIGTYSDGHTAPLDVASLFSYTVGTGSSRFQEMPRTQANLEQMASYLCKHFGLKAISLEEEYWNRPPGRRLNSDAHEPPQVTISHWMKERACGS